MAGGYQVAQGDAISRLVTRISSVQKQVQELQRPDGSQLADVVATLQAQVATINQILDSIVTPAVGQDSSTGFTLSTSYQTVSSFSLTVPDNCTRALVNANGVVSADTGSSSGDRLTTRIVIGGTNGPETVVVSPTTNPFPSSAAFQSRVVTGVSPGDTISVVLRAHFQVGPGATLLPSNAVLAAMAIFLP